MLIFLGSILFFQPNAYAKANNDFSKSYGLLVHNSNQNRTISKIKALRVLFKYFPDIKPKTSSKVKMAFEDVRSNSNAYSYVKKGCQLKLFDCSVEQFNPYDDISQKDFLEWFFELKYFKYPKYLNMKYPKVKDDYVRLWREARHLNLLVGNEITYRVFQEFLYRNKIVETNLNQPFKNGLAVDIEDINSKNYHNLHEIKFIQNNLKQAIDSFRNKKRPNKRERDYLKNLRENLNAFEKLETSLLTVPYILRERPDLDPEVTRNIRNHNLQDVLYSHSYDYSKNPFYRKHNFITGVEKMHGKVFEPGEVIDFWKIISDRGLWEFKYGWVIAEGEEQWKFGGGICGSSSLVFLSSWKSGLEILERQNHSQYFSNLYPMEDIGLDATVYRPRPNLKIRNNTNDTITFNVDVDKENEIITVEVIGNSPYKDVYIEGPIFTKKNQVKWIRHFEDFDGKMTSEILESRYGAIY